MYRDASRQISPLSAKGCCGALSSELSLSGRTAVPMGPARVERSAQTAELWFHKGGGDFWNGKPEQVQEFSGTMPGGARPSRVEPRRSVNNGAALRRAGL